MNAKFTQAILDEGLNPPAVLIPGTVQRVPGVDKDKDNKAGWILLFKDRQGGVFGDFSSGLKKYWHEAYETFSHEERKAFFKQCEEARNLVAAEREKEHQAAAEDTQKILGNAHGNPLTHSYAKRKGSQKGLNFGAGIKRGKWPQRGWDDALLAPMQDVDGTIWTLQAINVDGTKDFLKGGRKKGGFYPFGNINGAHRVLIGEGLATVAAVHAVDGAPAVAAMDAGSLPV